MGNLRRLAPRLLGVVALAGVAPGGCDCGPAVPPADPDAAAPDAFAGDGGGGGDPDAAIPDARPPGYAVADGLIAPDDADYDDLGPAATADTLRALLSVPIRDEAGLDATLAAIYDPASPSFRAYLTPEAWNAAHAPLAADVAAIAAWATAEGFTVARTASNRLLIELQGTVGQFNETFGVTLHRLQRETGSAVFVYGTAEELRILDGDVAARIDAVLTAEILADASPLPGESGAIEPDPPPAIDTAYQPARIARAYGVDALHAAGHRGGGVTIGLVVGATFKFKDVQSFWQGFGITRADPVRRTLVTPIATRFRPTTIHIEWAGALAPEAELLVYEGPDSRDTSLLYVYNEAIALGEVDVLYAGFEQRETAISPRLRAVYDRASKMGAALGVTVIAPAGDSTGTTMPGASAWVTSVGGTVLSSTAAGDVSDEDAWGATGHGESYTIPTPAWQLALGVERRAQNDLALNAGTVHWYYWLGDWYGGQGGTEFGGAAFAGMIASLDSARAARGEPRVGALNPALYGDAGVQASFRDVVEGLAGSTAATVGWDFPTGWGAPRIDLLDAALP